jgi:hypothetical protein
LSQLLALTRQSHINYLLTLNDLGDLNSFVMSKIPIFWIWHYSGDLSSAPKEVRELAPEVRELPRYQYIIVNLNDNSVERSTDVKPG